MSSENHLEVKDGISQNSLAQTLIESRWHKLQKTVEKGDFLAWNNKASDFCQLVKRWKEKTLLSNTEQKKIIGEVFTIVTQDYGQFLKDHLISPQYLVNRVNILSDRDFTATLNITEKNSANNAMGVTYFFSTTPLMEEKPWVSYFVLIRELYDHNSITRSELEKEIRPIKREEAVKIRQREKRQSKRTVFSVLTHELIEAFGGLTSIKIEAVREAVVEWFARHSLKKHGLINSHEENLLGRYYSDVKRVYDLIDMLFPIVGVETCKKLWLGDDPKAQKEFNKSLIKRWGKGDFNKFQEIMGMRNYKMAHRFVVDLETEVKKYGHNGR